MVNSGTTDWASILGTNELVKQNNFTSNINNKDSYVYEELKYDSFVIFTCHMFSSYSFWVNLFLYCNFFLISYYLKPGFVPCPEDKLIVHDLTTRVCEYC